MTKLHLAISACLMAGCLQIQAAENNSDSPKKYFSVGLGYATQATADYNESGVFPAANAQINFGSGGAFDLAVGSEIASTALRLEGELLFTGVDIDKFEDATYGTIPVGSDASSALVVGMFNVCWDFKNSTPVTPYVMGGIGAGDYTLDFDNGMGSASTGVLAGQLGLGASVALSDTIALDFKFKDIMTSNPEFDIAGGGTAKTEVNIQQYIAGVRFNF